MSPSRTQQILLRVAPALPLAMLLTACALSSMVLSSCQPRQPQAPAVEPKPLRLEGVPLVRVRLTHKPVSSATLWTTGGYRVVVDGQELGQSAGRLKKTDCLRNDSKWTFGRLTTHGQVVELHPDADALVGYGDTLYRGHLVLVPAGANTFYVHNHVDMESYLASVVARELYPSFHPEAFKAQAVAARTFALHEIATRGRGGTFDVWDSQQSQVYGGMSAESDKSWKAVRATHGWVLAYGPEGKQRVFSAMFSSCNGGYVNGAHVIQPVARIIPPLAGGQKDPDGKSCPLWSWEPVRVSKPSLYAAMLAKYPALSRLGGIETVTVRQATDYDRPIWLEFVGTTGQRTSMRAEKLRYLLIGSKVPMTGTLYSMNCKIRDLGDSIEFYDGHGFGHGVGLSQWGAEDKAKRGLSAEEILHFYYPAAEIMRAY